MTSRGVLALHRQLKKAYKLVQQCLDEWRLSQQESTPIIKSLENSCEQYDCCSLADVDTSPLKEFIDLKKMLLYQISTNIEEHITNLRAITSSQDEMCARITNQRSACMSLYQRYLSSLDVTIIHQGAALWPSIAEMLEQLCDIDRLMSQQLLYKTHLLDSLTHDSMDAMAQLVAGWTVDDQKTLEEIKGFKENIPNHDYFYSLSRV